MKIKSIALRLSALALVVLFIATLGACKTSSGQPVTVTINDNGTVLTVDGMDLMSVRLLLNKAEVKINTKDQVVPDLNVIWKDSTEPQITVKRYAKVTVTDGTTQQVVELCGGTVGEAVSLAGFGEAGLTPDADPASFVTDGMVITLSAAQGGNNAADGNKTPYYVDGVLQKNIIAETNGAKYYVNNEGIIDKGYCDGVTVDGENWIVINGVATKVLTESDKCVFAAAKDIAACTNTDMTKEEKAKAAFDYIKQHYLEGVLHDPPYREADWPIVVANDLFVQGKGDCFSYGAAFAYYLMAMGFNDVYASNSGGHGWAEAEGKAYDPEWSMHSNNYPYFAMGPDDECDVSYWTTTNDAAWKHKKIELNKDFDSSSESNPTGSGESSDTASTDDGSEDSGYSEEYYSDEYSEDYE